MILTRRTILLATVGFALSNTGQVIMAAPKFPDVVAYRNPGCSCCENWAKLMEKAGFKITMSDDPDLAATRKSLGIPESVAAAISLKSVVISSKAMFQSRTFSGF
jgi:hypothetical protein